MTEKFELLTSRFLSEFLSVTDISSKDTSSSFQRHFRQESYSVIAKFPPSIIAEKIYIYREKLIN